MTSFQYKNFQFRMNKTKIENLVQMSPIKSRKQNLVWISVAVTFFVLLGIGVFGYLNYYNANQNKSLGTYDDPEVAFRETQKALLILSNHLNVGMESVQYIQEYDNSKNLIFKQ